LSFVISVLRTALWYSEFDRSAELSPCADLSVALPPEGCRDANPKALSERTSYYQVR